MEFVPFWLRQRDCWFLGVSSWWKINSICVFLNRWMVDFYIFLWDEWLDLVFMVNVLSINIAVPWIQWDWKNGDVVESSILEWSLGNIMMPCFRMGMGVIQMLQKKGERFRWKKRFLEEFWRFFVEVLERSCKMIRKCCSQGREPSVAPSSEILRWRCLQVLILLLYTYYLLLRFIWFMILNELPHSIKNAMEPCKRTPK